MEIPPYEESKDVIQRKLDQTTMILQNINAYFLLIDKDFMVSARLLEELFIRKRVSKK